MEVLGVNEKFWHGKRVFLTGHTGFKGSWLSLWLQRMGAEVTGFALPPPTVLNLFEVARVADGMNSVIGDIRDALALRTSMLAAQPEIVIHMAAQALVRQGYADPVSTYSTNVMGTVHIFEAVRATSSVRAVINVTSDKCYENKEWVWGYRENDPMGGFDPYSSSKGCAELVANAYRQSYFDNKDTPVALASVRAGNVIGGGDWAADRLIPDALRAFAQGEAVNIRYPNAVRPWQHVLEPLSGYLCLAEKLHDQGEDWAGAWNFGPADNDAQSVQWVVERLASLWPAAANWVCDPQLQPHEAHMLKLDCSKARARLEWHPRWSLDEALKRVVDWQLAWQHDQDMRAFCMNQIAEFGESE